MASVGRPLYKKYSVKLLLLLLIVVLVTHHFMAGVLTQTTQRRDANWNSNNSQIVKVKEDCDRKIPLTSEDQKESSIVTEKIQRTKDNQAEQAVQTEETENTIRYTTRGLWCMNSCYYPQNDYCRYCLVVISVIIIINYYY